MRKILTLCIVMLSFLWTGCSAVHQETSPTFSETSLTVKTSRISEQVSKTYVVRFADMFCDKTPVTEQIINDAILRTLQVKMNKESAVNREGNWYIFNIPSVHWKDSSTLQFDLKKSLRENGQELQWLVRTYVADVQLFHDTEKKEFEVRVTLDNIVVENASSEYYQYVPDDMYVPDDVYVTSKFKADIGYNPSWWYRDFDVVLAIKKTMQEIMDENEKVIYESRPETYSFSKTLSGNPQAIRNAFTTYITYISKHAVVTREGVFYAGKQLLHIIDTSGGVTFMWNVELQRDVGLLNRMFGSSYYKWEILNATEKYVNGL